MEKFANFCENRVNSEFSQKFNQLCESILSSGYTFDEFWDQRAFPYLLTRNYQNENDIFLELNIGNWFGGNKNTQTAVQPNVGDVASKMYQGPQSGFDANKLNKMYSPPVDPRQAGAEQSLNTIKQKFSQAMRLFLKSANEEAVRSGDKRAYIIAQMFHDRVMKAIEPINVKYGKSNGEYQNASGKFQNQQTGMRQNMAKNLVANKPPTYGDVDDYGSPSGK